MAAHLLNLGYTLATLCLVALAVGGLLSRKSALARFQRAGLGLCLACVLGEIVFMGLISLPYDYQRLHPAVAGASLFLVRPPDSGHDGPVFFY